MTRRTEKVARTIQVQLAELINFRLADPRIDHPVTVTGVDVSHDLRQAVVKVTAIGATDAQLRTLLRALRHASGRLGHLLGQRLASRSVPRLDIRLDEQAIRTRQTLEAISEAMKQVRPATESDEDSPRQESTEG